MTLGTDKVLKDESHGSSLHSINQSLLNELSVVEWEQNHCNLQGEGQGSKSSKIILLLAKMRFTGAIITLGCFFSYTKLINFIACGYQ